TRSGTMRSSNESIGVGQQKNNKRQQSRSASRRKRVLAAASVAALASASAAPQLVRGATLTWAGTVSDATVASSGVYPPGNGQPLFNWGANATNWTGGAYVAGNTDVIFTDAASPGRNIRLPSGGMNPTSMTFSHVGGGVTNTYVFVASGDFIF